MKQAPTHSADPALPVAPEFVLPIHGFTGTPEEIARNKASITGQYLKPYLKR